VASQFDLSSYDAAYLELALRKGAGLATLDQHLASMAHRAGVSSVFPSYFVNFRFPILHANDLLCLKGSVGGISVDHFVFLKERM